MTSRSDVAFAGADDKAAVAPRVMQPPLPRPLKLSSNAGLVNGKMHSDKAQSLNEPFLGPPQWQARKVRTPVPSLLLVHSLLLLLRTCWSFTLHVALSKTQHKAAVAAGCVLLRSLPQKLVMSS